MTTEKTELELFLEERDLTALFQHWYVAAYSHDLHDSVWGRTSIATFGVFMPLTHVMYAELIFLLQVVSARRTEREST